MSELPADTENAVWREDAERLVERVLESLPEEGLTVLLLAALGYGLQVPAEVRRMVAPGAGDRRRLSRIFSSNEKDPKLRDNVDLWSHFPPITQKEVAPQVDKPPTTAISMPEFSA